MTSRHPSPRQPHRVAAVLLWIAGRAVSPGSPVPYGVAVGAVGVAYLGDSTPGQRLALASPPGGASRLLTAESGLSCPLPVGQQVKAVKAFREMLPVFRHPRCLNCHGGVDPLSQNHRGVDQLDPEIDRMVDREKFIAQCQDCHDQLPGWTTPGPPVFFVGKDDEELCMQMKRFEPTGEEFVDHIFNDHGEENVQFIAAGFVGDRALGQEGLRDYGLVAEKPPGTQAELTERARKWVEAVGDGYTASPKCGCVAPKIKLEVHHTVVSEVPNGLPSKEESQAKFEVKLEPMGDARPNMFAGEHSLNREIKMTLPPACKGKASRRERWLLYAMVDSVTGSIQVWHTAFDDEPTGGIECNQGRGTAKMGIFPGHASMVAGDVVIPGDSGSSKTLQAEAVGHKEALTITVLEVPSGQ